MKGTYDGKIISEDMANVEEASKIKGAEGARQCADMARLWVTLKGQGVL